MKHDAICDGTNLLVQGSCCSLSWALPWHFNDL